MSSTRVAILFLFLVGCSTTAPLDSSLPPPEPPPAAAPAPNALLAAIGDDYWKHELERRADLRLKFGLPVEQLPDPTLAAAQRDAQVAAGVLTRLRALDPAALNDEDRVTYGALQWEAQMTVQGLPYFWHESAVTPYASTLLSATRVFSTFTFKSPADTARYLRLMDEWPLYVSGLIDTVNGAAERGVRIPKAEVEAVRPFLAGFRTDPAASLFHVDAARLALFEEAEANTFVSTVNARIAAKINPSLQRLQDLFDDRYLAAAPDAVGLSNVPGGAEAYAYLVRRHTTLNLTPVAIHRIGIEEVARINGEMQQVRDRLGFKGTKAEFHQFLRSDPRFFAKTAAEVGERLTAHIRRIEPQLPRYFSHMPKAPYDVQRLDRRFESTATFGYYQQPTASDPSGHYFYNGSKLNERNLAFAASLAAHEIVPGHHMQIALQEENGSLPAWRREAFSTAFVEGWGEYAAVLGIEMGIYDDPYDRYGRLLMDAMLSSRLVVDTGMNALGWSREKASQFLRENTLMSETEIATETLRYAADIPGQALAYKIGSNQLLALRRRTKEQLGPKFDIRQFHDWVLGGGSLPLAVLEAHINDEVRKELQ
jgi:uncharacterized protein (DUF885 family)